MILSLDVKICQNRAIKLRPFKTVYLFTSTIIGFNINPFLASVIETERTVFSVQCIFSIFMDKLSG